MRAAVLLIFAILLLGSVPLALHAIDESETVYPRARWLALAPTGIALSCLIVAILMLSGDLR